MSKSFIPNPGNYIPPIVAMSLICYEFILPYTMFILFLSILTYLLSYFVLSCPLSSKYVLDMNRFPLELLERV